MCLQSVNKVTRKERSGYAYKIVKKIFVGVAEVNGLWKNFFSSYGPVYYRPGETVEITHKKKEVSRTSDYCQLRIYRAGIYLYKEPFTRMSPNEVDDLERGIAVLLLCKYEKAVAQDENQIVALRVTPIKVINPI